MRLQIQLEGYSTKIVHKASVTNTVTDVNSRLNMDFTLTVWIDLVHDLLENDYNQDWHMYMTFSVPNVWVLKTTQSKWRILPNLQWMKLQKSKKHMLHMTFSKCNSWPLLCMDQLLFYDAKHLIIYLVLKHRIMVWFYQYLQYPQHAWLNEKINATVYWKTKCCLMNICICLKMCSNCQQSKR